MKLTRGTSADSGLGLAICDGASVVAVVRGEGYPIGRGNGPRSEAMANLFAAAPELLAAAKDALALIPQHNRPACDPEWAKIHALESAIAAATADTFAPTMALALQKRTRDLSAWNLTDLERAAVRRDRSNGAGRRLTFVDGSAAFIPKGTADVRLAA